VLAAAATSRATRALTFLPPFRARDTELRETPATRATSRIVTADLEALSCMSYRIY
jgi:hypothetical protein